MANKFLLTSLVALLLVLPLGCATEMPEDSKQEVSGQNNDSKENTQDNDNDQPSDDQEVDDQNDNGDQKNNDQIKDAQNNDGGGQDMTTQEIPTINIAPMGKYFFTDTKRLLGLSEEGIFDQEAVTNQKFEQFAVVDGKIYVTMQEEIDDNGGSVTKHYEISDQGTQEISTFPVTNPQEHTKAGAASMSSENFYIGTDENQGEQISVVRNKFVGSEQKYRLVDGYFETSNGLYFFVADGRRYINPGLYFWGKNLVAPTMIRSIFGRLW